MNQSINLKILILASALALAACSRGGSNYTPPQSLITDWTAYYSTGVTRCDDFMFGEPHYCVRSMAAQQGQTIRMTFTTSGTGTLYPLGDSQPPRIALFLWRRGDDMTCAGPMQQYRYWYRERPEIVVGTTQMLTAKLDPALWTDCYGKPGSDNPMAFSAALQNLHAAGYTFGGASFSGHGVRANGQVRFRLESFTVESTPMGVKRRNRVPR